MILVYCLLGLVVLWLALGLVVFCMACGKPKPLPIHDPAELETRLGKTHSEMALKGMAWMEAYRPEELLMESSDGLMLRGRWIPAERGPRGTIIVFHGWHGSVETDLSPVFRLYHGLWLNILCVDQRAQNGSAGRFVTFGVKESQDVVDWVNYHNDNFPYCPVLLDGISMGGASVLLSMGRQLPENVVGVIADSSFTSPWEIIARVYRRITHLPPWTVEWPLRFWCALLAGFDPKAHSVVKAMKHSQLPVLMLHGTGDDYVPCAMTQTAFDAYGGKKELLLVEGAGHGMSYVEDPHRCIMALTGFCELTLDGKENEYNALYYY